MKAIVCALVVSLMVPSFAVAAIESIRVSNNNLVAVTISWTTDSSVMGEVHYSENPDLSNAMTAYDVRNQFFSGCTHYVEITGLTKETIYYFEVRAGGETDDNGGNYYTFRTMKQPQSIPNACTITGCVYEEDGTTLAVGAMVYLRVTHGGVESYPLSYLLGGYPHDATPGCFALNIKESRSTATDDLFPSIDPGDPIHIEVIDCGNYRADSGLVFDECFSPVEYLSLAYNPTGATTTSISATTTSIPATTTSISATTTSISATTTSIPGGGCTTDAECDDGVYCNGVETCDPEAGCQAGSPPCADDGEYCNGVESCNEEADACVSSGDPCEENELCSEEDDTCKPAIGIETSITAAVDPRFSPGWELLRFKVPAPTLTHAVWCGMIHPSS